MALIPVRSNEPINGDHFETEVDEAWLDRFPDDFTRLDGEDLIRYELRRAGVPENRLDTAVQDALALTGEPVEEVTTEAPVAAAIAGVAAETPADTATPDDQPTEPAV